MLRGQHCSFFMAFAAALNASTIYSCWPIVHQFLTFSPQLLAYLQLIGHDSFHIHQTHKIGMWDDIAQAVENL